MSKIEFETLKRNKFESQRNYDLYRSEKKKMKNMKYSLNVVIMCFILGTLLMLSAIALNNIKAVEYSYEEYVIQEGDTLFKIAKESNLDKQLNEIAWIIKNDNNVEAGNLQIGQIIKIKNEVRCK